MQMRVPAKVVPLIESMPKVYSIFTEPSHQQRRAPPCTTSSLYLC